MWFNNRFSFVTGPNTIVDFKTAVIQELVPLDQAKKAGCKLRNLKQTRTAARYLSNFKDAILMINITRKDKKVDEFNEGIKYIIDVNLLKTLKEVNEDL